MTTVSWGRGVPLWWMVLFLHRDRNDSYSYPFLWNMWEMCFFFPTIGLAIYVIKKLWAKGKKMFCYHSTTPITFVFFDFCSPNIVLFSAPIHAWFDADRSVTCHPHICPHSAEIFLKKRAYFHDYEKKEMFSTQLLYLLARVTKHLFSLKGFVHIECTFWLIFRRTYVSWEHQRTFLTSNPS